MVQDRRDKDLRDKDLRNKVQVQVQETLTRWINKTSKKHLSTRFFDCTFISYFLIFVLKNSVMLLFDFAMLSAWRK